MTFKGTHVRVPERRSWTVSDGGKGLLLPLTNEGLRARKRARERDSQGVARTRQRRRLAAPRRPRRELDNPLCTTPLDTTAFLTLPPSRTTRSCLRDVCIPWRAALYRFPPRSTAQYARYPCSERFDATRCNGRTVRAKGVRERKRETVRRRSQLAPDCSRESSRVETGSNITVSIFLTLHHFSKNEGIIQEFVERLLTNIIDDTILRVSSQGMELDQLLRFSRYTLPYII